jgi:nitroreductase
MNELLQTMLNRRSVRKYTGEAVPEDKLKLILQAGLSSATSKNRKPWEFVVVQNKDTLKALGKCRHPQQVFLPDTPAAIVVLGDASLTDVWVEDCSIAMTIMQLEAETLGLGSCWIQIRNRMAQGEEQTSNDFVKELLHIPEQYEVLAILAVGVPDEEKPGRMLEELQYSKIHNEEF